MARKKSTRRSKKKDRQRYFALTSFVLILIILISFFQLGSVGSYIDSMFTYLFGTSRYFTYVIIVLTSIYVAMNHHFPFTRRMMGYVFLQFGFIYLFHSILYFTNRPLTKNYYTFMETRALIEETRFKNFTGGGTIGQSMFSFLSSGISFIGTVMLSFVFIYFAIILIRNQSIEAVLRRDFVKVGEMFKSIFMKISETVSSQRVKSKARENKEKSDTPSGEDNASRLKKKHSRKKPLLDALKKKETKDEVTVKEAQERFEPQIFVSDEEYKDTNESSTLEVNEEESDLKIETEKDDSVELEYEEEELDETITIDAPKANTEEDELDDSEIKALIEYKVPPITLLKDADNVEKVSNKEVLQQGKVLEETLHNFGVSAKVSKIRIGPAVTQFEIQPDIGVKVSRIINLQNDIALSLAAKDIRIEAPIPGKSAVGIEVPNSVVSMVTLREVMKRKSSSNVLEVGLGKDISGAPIMAELNKMPHLLVAGSTGSGKSVCINGIIVSILLNAKPHEVKLMMIDPKMVELNVYNGIPHLLSPVVTNPQKAADALNRIVNEMERRYDLFSATHTKNISAYNKYLKKNAENPEKVTQMPYIVVIIDELADLMMVASKDVEASITRIAQMARAAGIHLIIATQRPSVDVITGIIKANIPSRIAFSVSSSTDSRTIIDSGGAEKLLGRGDMLFLPSGRSKPLRVQGAFLSDEEVIDVVEFVTSQMKANYEKSVILNQEKKEVEEVESEDELYGEAKWFVIEEQRASASLLQRQFRIGYNRAARLVDDLERNGIIGPASGSKPRNVLVQEQDV
ncbi:FtsK/SpoIIIE family DNA translocase [Phocicoccus pinnipedialis]|uniref:DNA translocase FtsK n=1 Tax=Phocicoccus pinnipedialis TaxID=110845 RepID=A0A6V7RHK3_9BACL|nr:DNA translocase FtsK [Jeotgalicoccus pinnipedialis]MBP1939130.1 S-DNA-T family DNA segregation ATPase FtsK/SpoIIIE [Jeotgalicoccus pinnipedialis]CAD2076671.1 DNA translocase FtsK [Jeotgalicoccus pinnipedialis]